MIVYPSSRVEIGFNQVTQYPGVHMAVSGDADAAALIAAMTTPPDSTRQTLIEDTIDDLKTAGLWTLIDALWFMAAHDSQAAGLNWKSPSTFTLSPQGSPTFTVDQGYAGNGSSSYVNTGFNPSTHGVNYTLNSASFGVRSNTDLAANGTFDMGARLANNNSESRLLSRAVSGAVAPRINSSAGANALVPNSIGLFVINRSASNAYQVYKDGSSVGTGTDASTNMPPVAFYLCATNTNGTAESFSSRQLAMAFIGGNLDSTKQSDLNTIVVAYLAGL